MLISIIIYCVSVLSFCIVFHYMKVLQTFIQITNIARQSIKIISDSSMDDYEKEKQIQTAAAKMLKCFMIVSLKSAVILIAAIAPIYIADLTEIIPLNLFIEFALRSDILAVTAVIFIGGSILSRKLNRTGKNPSYNKFSSAYSGFDRAIHNLAFGSKALQEILTDIEALLYHKNWSDISIKRPVFITSLPRSGTTMILEVLYQLPCFATQTYRDMPFILTPVLWNKLSSSLYSKGITRERAHHDGVMVGTDSPEAFEEIIWRKFYPYKYHQNRIELWDYPKEEMTSYFTEHIKKMIYLRCRNDKNTARYLSKNNGNIARINAIRKIFPDSYIIIPLRDPIEHTISLCQQHSNFLEQHSKDHFVRKYMEDICHYEFGVLHRPFDFPRFCNLAEKYETRDANYWLAYWISAFDYLSIQTNIGFVSYEALCNSGRNGLSTLLDYINVAATPLEIENAATLFHTPSKRCRDKYCTDKKLTESALEIYHELKNRSIF